MANLIRGSNQVEGALKKLVKKFEAAQKKINSSAAKRMKSGQYEAAARWMDVGKSFEAFAHKFEVIRNEWANLLSSSLKTLEDVESKKSRPPKSAAQGAKRPRSRVTHRQLYSPTLKALVARGGAASSEELLGDLHAYVLSNFPDSDLVPNVPSSYPPWQKIIRRTYKHFQEQRWIERRKDGHWQITNLGRESSNQ